MPRLIILSFFVLAALAGCRPIQLAGESLGHYAIDGTMVESSCGAGHPAPATTSFRVELRAYPGSNIGYWKLPTGPLVEGVYDEEERSLRFEQRTQHVGVEPDLERGIVGCTLEWIEVVTIRLGASALDAGVLDAGAADAGMDEGEMEQPALRGRTTIGITPVVGSNCAPLLLPYGGAFPNLPCDIRYELEGEAVEAPSR